MAHIRRLPSGKFQASVRLPNGKRVTRTSDLKRTVSDWAKQVELDIDRQRWRDPRANQMLFANWRRLYVEGKQVESSTRRGDEVCFRLYIGPAWDNTPLTAIRPSGIKIWLAKLESDGVGLQMRRKTFNLFRACLNAAVVDELLESNPASLVAAPTAPPTTIRYLEYHQVASIAERLPEGHSAMVWLMAYTGLRWGEAAGLRVGDVDWLRRRITVDQVVTQTGQIKAYPKTHKSRRTVPVPPEVLERMSRILYGKRTDDLIFTTQRGNRPHSGSNWRDVWDAALKAAEVPHESPHALRHTAASWLVQAGVPLYEVQRLLGHSSFAVTQRYAHLAPDAHGAVENAWKNLPAASLPHEGPQTRSDLH